jgi:tetratricopeptide (TPR) repeat protein
VAGLNPWSYALTQCEVIIHYLRLSVWPHPLIFDYAWPIAEPLSSVVPSAAVVLTLLGGTALALWRRVWVGFWGAWFFLILTPTSSILPIADVAFEHRMYLPLAAVATVFVVAGHDVLAIIGHRVGMSANARGGLGAALVSAAVLALGFATVRRSDDYRSEVAMWSDTVAKRPGSPRAHNNLGVALTKQGKLDEAVAEYAEAARLKPDEVHARNNLGDALFKQGRTEEAIIQFKEAVRARPTFAPSHSNLGAALMWAKRYDEAVDAYSVAVSLDPNSSQTHNALGTALYFHGRIKEAIVQYSAAIRVRPGFAEAHYNLGLALLEQGDTEGAIAQFSEAFRLKPDYAKPHNDLGILLYRQGRVKEAIAQFSEAARIDPALEEARKNLQEAQAGP